MVRASLKKSEVQSLGACSGLDGAKAPAGCGQGLTASLLFWEQIRGPENASIARFDGLGCYQSSSEKRGTRSAWAARKPLTGRLWTGSRRPPKAWPEKGASARQTQPGPDGCTPFLGANSRPRKRLHHISSHIRSFSDCYSNIS